MAVGRGGRPVVTARILVVDNEHARHEVLRDAVASDDVHLDLVSTERQLGALIDGGARWDVAVIDYDLGSHWRYGTHEPRSSCGIGVMSLLQAEFGDHGEAPDLLAMTNAEDEVGQLFLAAAAGWFGAGAISPLQSTPREIRDLLLDRDLDCAPPWLAPAVLGAAAALASFLAQPTAGVATRTYADFDWIRAYTSAHGHESRLRKHLPQLERTHQTTVYKVVNAMLRDLRALQSCFGGIDTVVLEQPPETKPAGWHKSWDYPLLTFLQRARKFFDDDDVAAAWVRFKAGTVPATAESWAGD
jgi:CheY-like chemotaxis protein